MTRRHTSGFDILGFDRDPTPGDPDGILSTVVTTYQTLGDDAASAAQALSGSEVAAGTGRTMDTLRRVIGTSYPEKLRTTATSFHTAADVYRRYAGALSTAQSDLDQAMDAAVPAAGLATRTVPAPAADATPEQLNEASAQQRSIDEAKTTMTGAERMAQDAKALRDRAAHDFATDLDATGTVPERSAFRKFLDFFKNNPIIQIIVDAIVAVVAIAFPVIGLALGVAALAAFTAINTLNNGGRFDVVGFIGGLVGVVLGGVGVLAKLVPGFGSLLATAGSKVGGFFTKVTGPIGKNITKLSESIRARIRPGAARPPEDPAREPLLGPRASDNGSRPPSGSGTPRPPDGSGTPRPSGEVRPEGEGVPGNVTGDVAEVAAGGDVLTRFLGGGALKLNKFLREPQGTSAAERQAFEADSRALSERLAELPAVSGRTFRGVEGDLVAKLDLKLDGTFTDPGFLSTSTSVRKAEEFIATGGKLSGQNETGAGTLFVVSGNSGRDVTGFTGLDEGEILFDKGTRFEVGGISGTTDLIVNNKVIKVRRVFLDQVPAEE